jgi:hypothetical protein
MAKTLSESAAEILKASMNAAKDPMQKPDAEMADLGGATTENPDGGEVGKKAAAAVTKAEAPAAKGDAKAAKTQAMEETETSETAEVVAEASQEETEVSTDEVAAETAEVVSEVATEVSEEELVEAKKEMMKGMVAKHKGSMKEDVDALFNGESLSEEFRTKATTIFEAAVQSRVESIIEDVMADNETILSESVEAIKQELSEQVDQYLNYVVEQWVQDNEVAIESGLRAELVDDFIGGLKNLFAEHYIEIPDEKVDVAEELALKVVELEESMTQSTTEAAQKIASLTEELNAAKKHEAIRKICEGLTEVQIGKMKSLAEGVEFTTEGEFNNKLAVIRENYFPANKVTSEVKAVQETTVSEEIQEVAQVNGIMAHYVKALTKTAPKA